MKQSQLFYKTLKHAPKEAEITSHKLLLRADLISQLASGIYSLLPLGFRVYSKIAGIVQEEMENIGAQEVFLPTMQPKEIWRKSDRLDHMDPPLFRLKDRHDKEFVLGPTHEEVITDLVKSRVESYKDLSFALFQIQNKFRNEMRFTGGLLRTREFMMKDLYSFHRNQTDLDEYFNKVLKAYDNIFKRCGLDILRSEASGGDFTNEKTYEYQALSKVGEDKVIYCPKCNWAANLEIARLKKGDKCKACSKGKLEQDKAIELGHTFRLGTKYSKSFNLEYIDEKGSRQPVVMGCYGIGLGRLMAAIIELNNDSDGIVWPEQVAPFKVHLIQIENNDKVKSKAKQIYKELQNKDIEVLYDDREGRTIGEKFAEADLFGIPYRVVISNQTLKNNCVEVKKRNKHKVELIKIPNLTTKF
tara:strand:- start:384 stop:1628 length:1245 start_codon:yes stop_codon:yes gene_type:complete